MGAGGLRGFFDERFVRNYDRCIAPLERAVFREARERLIGRAAGLVLDLGAGTGADLEVFRAPVESVVAVDRDAAMLDGTRTRTPSVPVRVVVADAESLPFPSDAFDTVVACLVFCTIPRPDLAFAEVTRVLVPGGRALFLEHVRSTSWILGILQDVFNPLQKLIAGGCNLNRRTEAILDAAGFRVLERRSRFAGILIEIEAISAS